MVRIIGMACILAALQNEESARRLQYELDELQSIGINNVRILASSEGDAKGKWRVQPCLQTEPGKYNEALFRALDELLVEIAKREMTAEERIFGGMSWSIRHHREKGGFYWHSEPVGLDLYKAFHWPGFESGQPYDEAGLLKTYRQKAFEIRGLEAPEVSLPIAPVLHKIENNTNINWKGAMGARHYEIWRQAEAEANWTLNEPYYTIDKKPYFSGYEDNEVVIGKSYRYKVRAVNESGSSKFSNESKLVKATHKLLVDHPENSAKYLTAKKVSFEQGKDRDFKELLSRMVGKNKSYVIYHVPGVIQFFNVFGFANKPNEALTFQVSEDGEHFVKMGTVQFNEYSLGDKLYQYKVPCKYSSESLSSNNQFLKINFTDTCYIGRVEIGYK